MYGINKKIIGLSVCYDTKNFGSQLQVLATVKKLEELGYDVEIIQYIKKLTPKFIMQTIPRLFNPYFIKGKLGGNKKRQQLKRHPNILKQIQIRDKKFEMFVKENFADFLKPFAGWETLCSRTSEKYDAFLCGSDQLWLPSNLGSHFYTLEFAPENKPKIAYATSFGVNQIPWFQKNRTANYLNRFSSLSSREEKGAEIIKNLTDKEIPVVCDPTMLLTFEEWMNIIPKQKKIKEDYIFCYFLGGNIEHRKLAEEVKKKTKLSIVTIPFLDDFFEIDQTFGDEKLFDVDASDFVNLIRNAKYVITDSFHGSVFSILNHKQFVILNRFEEENKNSRNSRIDNLCSMFELERRHCPDNILEIIDEPIDYLAVDQKLGVIRDKSVNYLSGALEKINSNMEIGNEVKN